MVCGRSDVGTGSQADDKIQNLDLDGHCQFAHEFIRKNPKTSSHVHVSICFFLIHRPF